MPKDFPAPVPDPHIEKRLGKVVVSLDKDETYTLLSWLDGVDTSKLSDHQYLYFIKFKQRLSLMNNVNSNVTITPVAEEKASAEDIAKLVKGKSLD